MVWCLKWHLRDQSWGGAVVWCQKGVFAGPTLVGCCGLVSKRGICGTKVVGLLRLGAKKWHLRDQSCGVAVVWCQKEAFVGPKLGCCCGLVLKSGICGTKGVGHTAGKCVSQRFKAAAQAQPRGLLRQLCANDLYNFSWKD